MIVKIFSIIKGCETLAQINTAIMYIRLASKAGRIDYSDYHLAFDYCKNRIRQITREILEGEGQRNES